MANAVVITWLLQPEQQKLLDEHELNELYDDFYFRIGDTSELTKALLQAGIDANEILENLNWIPNGCFRNSDIERTVIPKHITDAGESAFAGCNNLTDVIIEDGRLSTLPYEMFSGCLKLRYVDIPVSICRVNAYAFWGCSSLKEIRLSSNIDYIESRAFEKCSLIINYNGTKDDFENIEKEGSDWCRKAKIKVKCTDGILKYGSK